ncbi:MAG: S41 family peptidase [Salinivirgaceae bacterium]|nr:S41 family peptidase [Salinivirgaceae bacterium]
MKRITLKLKLLIGAVLIAIVVGFVSFDDENFQIIKNLDIYHTLFRELNLYYVDETDPGDLVKTSIDKMLSSLDPYTVYIPESNIEDYKFMTTGQYGGIGALIRKTGDYVIITEPYEGFPAQKAGLKAGDKIVQIDGKNVKGKSSGDISELLKGEPNTEIKLEISRPGLDKNIEKVVSREKIKISSVPYSGMLNDSIGYIRLTQFTENCSKEVKDAFKELKRDNELKGLVFDLRGNPGGLLHEAVNVSNIFVPKGQEVVSTKGKVKQWNRTYNATMDAMDTEIPLVVLVNRGSASASEIVSGVIQDLDRGVVIGTRTFGKGLVQTTRDLSYNSKLKITTAKYYIPSGRCIQALDYSNRNEDGSVGRVPDSLITEFKTHGGRKVFDGGGVMPDIEVESPELSKIAISLYTKNLIFDYATDFTLKNDSIAKPEQFEINDQIYNDFTSFLADKDFDYTLESESLINKLETVIKKEKYHDVVSAELELLRKKLAHDKNNDLQMFRSEISELLRDEIVSRYYYQIGRAKTSIKNDPLIEKAILILNNKKEYQLTLSPSIEG